MNPPSIKIVIPAFRESTRIGNYVSELTAAIATRALPFNILVVDDGSGLAELKKTEAVLAPFLKNYPTIVHLLALPENQGKGGAIKAGWDDLRFPAEYLAFVDADGSVPAAETIRFLEQVPGSGEKTCLFGSRIKMLGRTIHRSLFRHLIGRVFATLVSVSLDLPIYDSQCGCKVIPAHAYQRIRSVLQENGFAFDVELTAALMAAGCVVREVPVDWSDVPGSKLALGRDSLRMFFSCLSVQRRSRKWSFPPTG